MCVLRETSGRIDDESNLMSIQVLVSPLNARFPDNKSSVLQIIGIIESNTVLH